MLGYACRLAVFVAWFLTCCGNLSAQGWQHMGRVERVKKLPDGMELTAGKAKVRVTAFRDGIVRVRVAPDGNFPTDFSGAVVEAAEPPAVTIEEGNDAV